MSTSESLAELEDEGKGTDAIPNEMLINVGHGPPHVIAVHSDLVVSSFQEDDDSHLGFVMDEEHGKGPISRKRAKTDHEHDEDVDISGQDDSTKELLINIHKLILGRISLMNEKIENLGQRCQNLDAKLTAIADLMDESGIALPALNFRMSNLRNTITSSNLSPLGPNMTLITLNSEEDFPCGSWLGDECNPDMRVRTRLTPSDLDDIHRLCHTPEKMALTLLDFLFDRETQACSNISGMGKHGKRQLDPLLVYGIRCHLIHRFNIGDKDWQRIKLNLDSKCRTAYRRKQRGMPLAVKAFQERMSSTYVRWSEGERDVALSPAEDVLAEGLVLDPDPTADHDESVTLDVAGASVPVVVDQLGETQIIHTAQGDIEVVHATLSNSWLNSSTVTRSSS